jgi:hypothetical protein
MALPTAPTVSGFTTTVAEFAIGWRLEYLLRPEKNVILVSREVNHLNFDQNYIKILTFLKQN